MTKEELNERLAETFESKPNPMPGVPADGFWVGSSLTHAWVANSSNGEWQADNFTTPYWFHRLIVEHRIQLEDLRRAKDGKVWWAKAGNFIVEHDDPAIAVAECALKIREMGKVGTGVGR